MEKKAKHTGFISAFLEDVCSNSMPGRITVGEISEEINLLNRFNTGHTAWSTAHSDTMQISVDRLFKLIQKSQWKEES